MLPIIILSIIHVSYAYYEKISKYSSVKVYPYDRVYLDISSYKENEIIKLEFSMDFSRSTSSRFKYTYEIGQVFALSSFIEGDSGWNSLHTVTNGNYSCDSSYYCYFKWNETKQFGKNYIFIIPSRPYTYFDSNYYNNKIKVNHLGGLSAGAIVGIVFGCIGGVVLLIVIIYKCCNSPQKPDYVDNNPQAPLTTVQPIIPTVVQPVTPVVQPIVPVQPIVQVQPMVPTYGPPPPQPYVHNVY